MDTSYGSNRSEASSGPVHSANVMQSPQTPYRFTNDELRVLRQCNKESFFQRCLPLSTILSIGTYYAVKSGYMKNHPRYGPTPKVLLSAAIGYFVGKFSYQSKCAEKLMQLPNSPIGDMLRQRKLQGGYQEILSDTTSITWPHMEPSLSDLPQDPLERPILDGLDYSLRPSFDSPIDEDSLPPQTPHTTSYEELRQKNREEYEMKRFKVSPRSPSTANTDGVLIHAQPLQSESERIPLETWGKEKNKYGDIWEE